MTNTETHLGDGTLLQGGKYKVVRFLSSGGFGCTYEAEHVMLEKKVALKEFFVSDYCNRNPLTGEISLATEAKAELLEKLKRKFLEEAQAVSRMDHPHIVGVSDVFEENGTAYYAMDFIEGQSLADMLKHKGLLPEDEAVGYIRQVADALSYVHSLNRLHLDIKPGNIMLDKDGKAILIDFGTSKQYDEANGENTSTLMGRTPGYAPPEQMDNSVVHFTPSTDIYALGATLYKLLTGITPPSSNQLLAGDDIVPLPADISQQTRKAVTTSMQLRKDERPQSIKEFLALLDSPSEEKAPQKKSKNPIIVAVLIAAVCLAAIVVGIVLSKGHVSTPEEETAAGSTLVDSVDTVLIAGTDNATQATEHEAGQSSSATSIQEEESLPTEPSEIEKLKKRAEQGDAKAQSTLGLLYEQGDGATQSYTEAVKWYKKAAEQGYARAQYHLGMCYYDGDGVDKNYTEAVKWYRKAAEQGDEDAQYSLGCCYANGEGVPQNWEEAVKWCLKAAEQGRSDAQYNLGVCYANGTGVSQSYTEAVKWYRKAAEQGLPDAQYNLGDCYANGTGVSQSYTEAVKWTRKAAEQGYALAQYNLGGSYQYGTGVSQNYAEAVKWIRKAADQGLAEAQYNLGVSYQKGAGVSQNSTEAVKWYRKAAEQGLAEAQYNLGACYDNGDGVSQNSTEAVKWFRKAADQGLAEAQYNLGSCYGAGDGVAQDYAEAVKWTRKAAEQGLVYAQYSMGLCYYSGDGVTKSPEEAVKWWSKAADQGLAEAQYILGYCYVNGEGVTQNFEEGVKWLRKAAKQGDADAKEALEQLGETAN